MDLYLKHPDYLDGQYFVTGKDFSAVCPYAPGPEILGLCWEYDIIQKINKNEDGYFDFSKNLIDIGSEDGGYAIHCNFAKNYCFEPNKEMCCLIYTNMYLKGKVDNTEVYNVFLGDNTENTIGFDGFSSEKLKEDTCLEYGKSGGGRCKEIVQVRQHLLDEYDIQNVGLIKVDTEGFDYFVLKGGINTIINNDYPPILYENWAPGEYDWSQENHDRLDEFLKSLGYTIFEQWGSYDTHLAVKLDEKHDTKYIVSMTTIPKRKSKLVDVNIKSILEQSYKFDKFVINIDDNLNWDDYEFYFNLKNLDERIEVNVCDHKWRSCNKLLPTLKKYPNDVIIVVDDDICYPKDCILKLVEKYEKNKDCIIAHEIDPIVVKESKFKGYCYLYDVKMEQKEYGKYLSNCCLFPPHVFDGTDLFNYEKMMELTEGTHDELWFWVNSTLKGVKCIGLKYVYSRLSGESKEVNESVDGYSLWGLNMNKTDWFNDKTVELYGDRLNEIIPNYKIEFVLDCDNVFSFIHQIDYFKDLYGYNYKINVDNLTDRYVNILKTYIPDLEN